MNMLSLETVMVNCAVRLFDRLYQKGGRDTSHIIVFSVICVLVSSVIVVTLMPSANFVFFFINLIGIALASLLGLGTLFGITLEIMSAYHLFGYVFSTESFLPLVSAVPLIYGVIFLLIGSYTCGIYVNESNDVEGE